eukprot:4138966-Amphidinium_carterae.1
MSPAHSEWAACTTDMALQIWSLTAACGTLFNPDNVLVTTHMIFKQHLKIAHQLGHSLPSLLEATEKKWQSSVIHITRKHPLSHNRKSMHSSRSKEMLTVRKARSLAGRRRFGFGTG